MFEKGNLFYREEGSEVLNTRGFHLYFVLSHNVLDVCFFLSLFITSVIVANDFPTHIVISSWVPWKDLIRSVSRY